VAPASDYACVPFAQKIFLNIMNRAIEKKIRRIARPRARREKKTGEKAPLYLPSGKDKENHGKLRNPKKT